MSLNCSIRHSTSSLALSTVASHTLLSLDLALMWYSNPNASALVSAGMERLRSAHDDLSDVSGSLVQRSGTNKMLATIKTWSREMEGTY